MRGYEENRIAPSLQPVSNVTKQNWNSELKDGKLYKCSRKKGQKEMKSILANI